MHSQIIPLSKGSMLHISPTNSHLLTAEKKTKNKKPISRRKQIWKVGRRMNQKQKREKIEGATGLGQNNKIADRKVESNDRQH